MGDQPPESAGLPVSWRRMTWPLIVVLVLATLVGRRDVHLSWLARRWCLS